MEAVNVWHIPIYIFLKTELGHTNVSKATIMSCLDKSSNLCVIFLINPFICKWLRLAPRCKQWGPECWIKVCYLLCGLLISVVSVVPDCVTTECCDCLSFSAASALTPRHFFIHSQLWVWKESSFSRTKVIGSRSLDCLHDTLMCWYVKSNGALKFPNFYLTVK